MIELKDQVCDLKYAKQLKKLGLEQDSIFYWVNHWQPTTSYVWDLFQKDEDDKVNEHISAFTVPELIIELLKYREERNILYLLADITPNSLAKRLINKVINANDNRT